MITAFTVTRNAEFLQKGNYEESMNPKTDYGGFFFERISALKRILFLFHIWYGFFSDSNLLVTRKIK